MHCVKIFYVTCICFIDDRQAGPSKKNMNSRGSVSVSYFLHEWTVSSVLYVLHFYCTFCVVFGGFYNAKSVGFWGFAPDSDGGAYSAPPYPPSWVGGLPPSCTLPEATRSTRLPLSTTRPYFVQRQQPWCGNTAMR